MNPRIHGFFQVWPSQIDFGHFKNVHFAKGPHRSVKNLGNMGCDHYALISIFS